MRDDVLTVVMMPWVPTGMFVVGPESAGAYPGPICYRRHGSTQLTITDANLYLGRIRTENFPRIFGPNQDQGLGRLPDLGCDVMCCHASRCAARSPMSSLLTNLIACRRGRDPCRLPAPDRRDQRLLRQAVREAVQGITSLGPNRLCSCLIPFSTLTRIRIDTMSAPGG